MATSDLLATGSPASLAILPGGVLDTTRPVKATVGRVATIRPKAHVVATVVLALAWVEATTTDAVAPARQVPARARLVRLAPTVPTTYSWTKRDLGLTLFRRRVTFATRRRKT